MFSSSRPAPRAPGRSTKTCASTMYLRSGTSAAGTLLEIMGSGLVMRRDAAPVWRPSTPRLNLDHPAAARALADRLQCRHDVDRFLGRGTRPLGRPELDETRERFCFCEEAVDR